MSNAPKMGEMFPVTLEEALAPMIGSVAEMVVEGHEVTAKLVFVNHEQATFKVVPKGTRV